MEEDDERLCRFGTPLDPLEEDEIPSKKPIQIEDQIVTDSNGRRRFHGAFTGGFSAGFWNTVGSLEGWQPQSFKSSRSEKAGSKILQKPTDFMDEEDLGEFGIAPQRVQTTEDFTPQDSNSKSTKRKRKLQNSIGPIPGIPVLNQLLQPAKENVAIRLLKKMGWKMGQGIGARQTRKEKKAASERNARERYVMKKYGCDLGTIQNEPQAIKDVSEDGVSDISDEEITFAPEDFEPFLCGFKDNSFGLGYSGLSRDPVLKKQQQHIDLFGPFEVLGKDNKKLSIRGQAFGVGALEEEDEDIYNHDDLTKYDFSLGDIKKAAKPKRQLREADSLVIEGFHAAKVDGGHKKKIFKISLPSGFKPRNWTIRKTRFEPLDDNRSALLSRQDGYKSRGLGRHDLNPEERGNILGEQTRKQEDKTKENFETGKKKNYLEKINEKYKTAESKHDKVLNLLDSKAENFSKGEVLNTEKSEVNELEENVRKENEEVQAEAKKITKSIDNKPVTFKPFIIYEPKQERYDKFIEANLNDDEEITKFLASIQPLNMSEWDREMEKKEFLQAKKIYKPLKGLMSDRFVSEATVWAEKESTDKSVESKKKIEIKRTKVMWKPCSQLCKRFNVPEPFGGTMVEVKTPKKSRFSIFDYLETSINTRDNFVTPVIIPTKAEKPKAIIIQDKDKDKHSSTTRLSTKEIFSKEITKPREFIPSTSKQTVIDSVEETKNITTEQITTSTSTSVVSDLPKKSARPKSDLEKKIEELKNKHPSEKKDLFKAIFDSSSEDEADDEDQKEEEKHKDEPKTVNTSKNIIDILKKTPAELNILRNTSPPRGIFAYLFKKKPKEPKTLIVEENIAKTEIIDDASTSRKKEISPEKDIPVDKTDKNNVKEPEEDIYGPKIPTLIAPAKSDKLLSSDVVSISEDVDRKLYKLLKKSKKSTAIVEEWVEKTDISKKSKMRKKEKDKKKKSKKHKKDKKSKR